MDQENLLPFDTPSNNNNIQYFNNEQNNNENTLSFTQNYITMIIVEAIVFSALIIGFIVLINSKPNPLAIFIYANVILSVGFFYVVSLFLAIKEIQFIKNTNLNQLTIKIKKVCCFTSRQYTLILENAYIYCEKDGEKRTKIFILNTLKNPREIDLDKSNIKTSPINLLNEHELWGNYNEIKIKIDNFMGQQNFENNICDEINKYISLYDKNYEKHEKKLFDKYMKITDHFYSFLFYVQHKRIDFIYSDDFGRLFIGEVNGSRYKNTLLFNISEIDSFEMVANVDEDSSNYYIKINDKNHQQSQISIYGIGSYYASKNYLEKFILLLNGKLKDINEKKINNNNDTPLY